MNERLTLQDLIDILAKKQDVTKKDAETFLRELVAVISENIENNEPVRIKDFGTFKLVKVNARKSVDVNTGEAIEIPAHYKLSFTPDKSLKEAINRPFAHFESVVLEDGVTFENMESEEREENIEENEESDITIDEEVNEIVIPVVAQVNDVDPESILLADAAILEEPDAITEGIIESGKLNADKGSVIEEEIAIDDDEPISEIIENTEDISEPDDSQVTDMSVPDNADDGNVSQDVDDTQSTTTTITPNTAIASTHPKTESDEMFEKHKRKTRRRRFISLAFISLLIIAAFAVGGFYFLQIMESVTGESKPAEDKYKTKVVYKRETPIDSIKAIQSQLPADSTLTDTNTNEQEQTVQDKNKPLAIHTLDFGETLRKISLKYYGHKSFWPYIYEENKDVIKNPNSVPVGTKFVIPSPAKYGIDAKNEESLKKVKEIESKLVSEMNL